MIQTQCSIILIKNTKSAIVTADQNHQLFYCFMACRHQPYGFSFSLPYHWLYLHSLTQLIYALSLPTQRWLDLYKSARIDFPAVTRWSTRWQKSITETIPVIWAPTDKTVGNIPLQNRDISSSTSTVLIWIQSLLPSLPSLSLKIPYWRGSLTSRTCKTNHEARRLQLIGMNQTFGVLFD